MPLSETDLSSASHLASLDLSFSRDSLTEASSCSKVSFSALACDSSLLSARYLDFSSALRRLIFSSIVSYLAIFSLRLPPSLMNSIMSDFAVSILSATAFSSSSALFTDALRSSKSLLLSDNSASASFFLLTKPSFSFSRSSTLDLILSI